jgi:hypothetical protein
MWDGTQLLEREVQRQVPCHGFGSKPVRSPVSARKKTASPYSERKERNARKGGVRFVLGAFALHRSDSERKARNAFYRRQSFGNLRNALYEALNSLSDK